MTCLAHKGKKIFMTSPKNTYGWFKVKCLKRSERVELALMFTFRELLYLFSSGGQSVTLKLHDVQKANISCFSLEKHQEK